MPVSPYGLRFRIVPPPQITADEASLSDTKSNRSAAACSAIVPCCASVVKEGWIPWAAWLAYAVGAAVALLVHGALHSDALRLPSNGPAPLSDSLHFAINDGGGVSRRTIMEAFLTGTHKYAKERTR